MEGEGAYTIVDGHKMTLGANDFVLTPNGTWHEHGVAATARPASGRTGSTSRWSMRSKRISMPCIPKLQQDVGYPVDDMTRAWGNPGLRPAGAEWTKAYSPLLKYEWGPTYEALLRYAKATDGSPFDGVLMNYVNPVTGGPVMQTIGASDADAAAGREDQGASPHRQRRSIRSPKASGYSIIDGKRFDWNERDIFCVPSWAWHEHGNASASEDACLFAFNDLPVMQALGLYREEAYGDNQGRQPLKSRGSVMRLVTYRANIEAAARLGAVVDEEVVDVERIGAHAGVPLPSSMLDLIDLGSPATMALKKILSDHGNHWPVGTALPLANVRLLAPIPRPRKNIFGIGLNYVEHVAESSRALDTAKELPKQPIIFSKPPTSVIGPDEAIEHNRTITQQLDWEVELAVVMGRTARRVSGGAGARLRFRLQRDDRRQRRDNRRAGQWIYSKGQDTYAPFGPCIVTADEIGDPHALDLWLTVNGVEKQRSNTRHMLFKVPLLIADISAGDHARARRHHRDRHARRRRRGADAAGMAVAGRRRRGGSGRHRPAAPSGRGDLSEGRGDVVRHGDAGGFTPLQDPDGDGDAAADRLGDDPVRGWRRQRRALQLLQRVGPRAADACDRAARWIRALQGYTRPISSPPGSSW